MRLEITGKIKVMKYRRSGYVVEPRKLSKFGVATVTCNCKSSGFIGLVRPTWAPAPLKYSMGAGGRRRALAGAETYLACLLA